jgi:predicted metalloprotease
VAGPYRGGYAPPGRRRFAPPGPPGPYAMYGPPRWYGHARPLPPRRRGRSAAGVLAGLFGLVAGLLVVAVLALAALGAQSGRGVGGFGGISSGGEGGEGGPGEGGQARPGTRSAAAASPLYRSGRLSPVSCRVPQIQPGSSASMNRFLDVLTNCLDRSWRRQFGKIDVAFTRPNRVFWNSPGSSPCGSYPAPGAAAFYCPANNTIYIGLQHVIETAGDEPVSNYAVYARVIAHEYGHHVQEESGILSYGYREMEAAGRFDRLEISRRIELQAQCFAGSFLGAERRSLPMTQQQYEAMIDDVSGRGDDRLPPDKRDHGSGRHYASWMVRGYRELVLTSCNTWTVPSSEVS